MINVEALGQVKKKLQSNIGEKVMLKANRGRKKTYIKEGIIQDTYGSVFTIQVDINQRSAQTLSYTYCDVLTSNVELTVCRNNEKIWAV